MILERKSVHNLNIDFPLRELRMQIEHLRGSNIELQELLQKERALKNKAEFERERLKTLKVRLIGLIIPLAFLSLLYLARVLTQLSN